MRLPEHVENVLDETYEQRLRKPVRAIKLPCSDNHRYKDPVIVQVTVTGDQRITCPKCGKQHFLTWSKREEGMKWAK